MSTRRSRQREHDRSLAKWGDNLRSVARPDGSIPIADLFALVPGQDIGPFRRLDWMGSPVVLRIRCGICGVEWASARRLSDGRHLLKVRAGLAVLGEAPSHRHRFEHCGSFHLVTDRKLLDLAERGTEEAPSMLRVPRSTS